MSIGILVLAGFLTWFSFHRPNILISISAGVTWLGLAMWMFFGTTPLFDLGETHSKLLVWVFFMLTFVPFLALMDTAIQYEKDGKRWTEWGARPQDRESSYDKYKTELRRRVRK